NTRRQVAEEGAERGAVSPPDIIGGWGGRDGTGGVSGGSGPEGKAGVAGLWVTEGANCSGVSMTATSRRNRLISYGVQHRKSGTFASRRVYPCISERRG